MGDAKHEYEKTKHSFWDEMKHIDGLGSYSSHAKMDRLELLEMYLEVLPHRGWWGEGSYSIKKHYDDLVRYVKLAIEREEIKQSWEV